MSDNKDKSKKNPYPHIFRITHLILSALILVMIITGLGIFAIARPEWTYFDGHPAWIPAGRLGFWHMLSAIFFTPAMLIASIDIIKRRGLDKFLSSRWFANYLLIFGGTLCVASGFPLLYTGVSDNLYHFSRMLHAVTGLIIIPAALLIHLIKGLGKNRKLLPLAYNLSHQPAWAMTIVLLAALALSWAVTLQYPPRGGATRQLHARPIENASEDLKLLPWDKAEALVIQLANGHGFDQGRTRVSLRAMHDGTDLFILAEWDDPREDLTYWPWKKTENGWVRLVDNLDDETVYYEDKFSLLFPIGKDVAFDNFGCAISCHQSTRMPYGLKIAKKPIDVWHWKATRTGSMGYIDDKYWMGTDLDDAHAGRHSDSKESGGYTMNLSEDKKTPLFLPTGDSYLRTSAIDKKESEPFTEDNQKRFPVGSVIPGIAVSPAVGDRGDVKCIPEHSDGRWHLYIRRKLDTGSDRDAIFEPGKSYSFGCAAFDHSAKRHAYNHGVYRLYIDK